MAQIVRDNTLTFFNFLNIVLAAIVLIFGEIKNAMFIGVILCNTGIGIVQEIRAKRTIDRLTLISAPKAHVIRDGSEKEILNSQIVEGDLVVFRSGMQASADCEIVQGECEVNESLITGESDPVYKKPGDKILSGSFIVSGESRAVAVGLGADSFANKITSGAKYVKKTDSKMMRAIKAWRYSSGMPVKAPSQIITYVSAHDNQTLWDKLAVTTQDEELRLRQNHMAAAVYMTCQGIPFLLSGEEFARTKDGNSNSYNAPITLNRLDWNRAYAMRDLVRYYQGLIALRKKIPGLCDKSEDAWRAIKTPWHEDGIVGFFVSNAARYRSGACRWNRVYILYNSTNECSEVPLPAGEWRVLLDGEDSFLWENEESEILTGGEFHYVRIAPVSVLILGEVGTPQ